MRRLEDQQPYGCHGGWSWPLVSRAAAGSEQGALILVDRDDATTSRATMDWLTGALADVDLVAVSGGRAAVSAEVFESLRELLGGDGATVDVR